MRILVPVLFFGVLGVHTANTLGDRARPTAPTAPSSTAPVSAAPAPAPAAGAIALHADRRGHFHAAAVVDGRALDMLVDTGATTCAFSEEDAARVGIRVGRADFTRSVSTANGVVRVAPVRVGLIRIGAVSVRDVEAVVVPRGAMTGSLLGMSFLKRVREFGIAGGTMTLRG